MSYASGKSAYGISDRSGFRYKLKEMKREWTGALVGPDEYEPKHPQLKPPKAGPDPQALRNPRPDRTEPLKVYVGVRTPEIWENYSLFATAKLSQVEVTVIPEEVLYADYLANGKVPDLILDFGVEKYVER
jgi:hypothetical protein